MVQGYKDHFGIGYHWSFLDPLYYTGGGLTVAYTPNTDVPSNERAHVELNGAYLGWRGGLSWNRSDFYDLFGPTKRSRKGFAAKAGYDDYRIYEDPRRFTLSYDLEYYDKIDTLPNAQNVSSGFSRLLSRRPIRSAIHRSPEITRRS